MDNIRKVVHVAFLGIRKLLWNPRLYLLLGMLTVILLDALEPIREFSRSVGYRITPWFYTFLLRDTISYGLMLLLGLVLLFCDAPFLDAGQTSVIIRVGKKNWCYGQLLYIFLCTGLYLLVLFGLLCLVLGPDLTIQTGWGKVLTTAAYPAADVFIRGPVYPWQIIGGLPGAAATLLTFLAHWLAGFLLGAMMFFLNLRYQQKIGAIAGTALVLLRAFVRFIGATRLARYVFFLSPFTIILPEHLQSFPYTACVFGGLLLVAVLLIFASIRTILSQDLPTLNEI